MMHRESLPIGVSRFDSPSDGATFGGDWSSLVSLTEKRFALTIGDVSGHGSGRSTLMAMVRDAVIDALLIGMTPAESLAHAHGAVRACDDDLIVTAIAAIVDRDHRTLTFANAGHPPPLLVTGAVQAFLERADGDVPLGVHAYQAASDSILSLPSDAMIVFYTDGVTEHARDLLGGERKLMSAARELFDRGDHDLAYAVAHRVFAGSRGDDDAAMIVLRTGSPIGSAVWFNDVPSGYELGVLSPGAAQPMAREVAADQPH